MNRPTRQTTRHKRTEIGMVTKALRIFLMVLLCMCARAVVVSAQDVQSADVTVLSAEAQVDKSIITIGEKIRYSVMVTYRDDLTIVLPDFVNALGGFTVKNFGQVEPKRAGKGYVRQSVWYELDTYLVGSYIIPAVTVRAQSGDGEKFEAMTPEMFIEVKSVVANDDTMQDIRDIHLPILLAMNTKKVLWVSGIIVLVLTFGYGIYWWFRVRPRTRAEVIIVPHERAYKELERIYALHLIENGKIKEYYFLLSACLRVYIEEQFSLRIREQTTEEFLDDVVKRHGVLTSTQKQFVADFLCACDFVKFAKYTPEINEITAAYTAVKSFIDETHQGDNEGDGDTTRGDV